MTDPGKRLLSRQRTPTLPKVLLKTQAPPKKTIPSLNSTTKTNDLSEQFLIFALTIGLKTKTLSISDNITRIKTSLPTSVTLIAVSKTKPLEDILSAYQAGQRVFGENKAQEMTAKYTSLPKDIQWHMIGHLQTNKIKYISPFVTMIHSVDSVRLLVAIDTQAEKNNRVIDCLLQVHIASEETKYGFSAEELKEFLASDELKQLKNTRVRGLMGMASNTDDMSIVRTEFEGLKKIFDAHRSYSEHFDTLSMGMSGDYKLAVECGSTMVRVGSSIFGHRDYTI